MCMYVYVYRLLLKMDSWAKQGEAWREDVESQMTTISRQLKNIDRLYQTQADSTMEMVTRNDLDLFKERVVGSISTSNAAWKERMESQVSSLSRQPYRT
jgi:predicted lipoprotein